MKWKSVERCGFGGQIKGFEGGKGKCENYWVCFVVRDSSIINQVSFSGLVKKQKAKMGRDFEFLEAARLGDVLYFEKFFANKKSRPLTRFKI